MLLPSPFLAPVIAALLRVAFVARALAGARDRPSPWGPGTPTRGTHEHCLRSREPVLSRRNHRVCLWLALALLGAPAHADTIVVVGLPGGDGAIGAPGEPGAAGEDGEAAEAVAAANDALDTAIATGGTGGVGGPGGTGASAGDDGAAGGPGGDGGAASATATSQRVDAATSRAEAQGGAGGLGNVMHWPIRCA